MRLWKAESCNPGRPTGTRQQQDSSKLIFLRQHRAVFRLFRRIDFNGCLDDFFPSGKNHDESSREQQHDDADRAR